MSQIYRIQLSITQSNKISKENLQNIKDFLQIHPSISRFALYKNNLALLLPDGSELTANSILNTIQKNLGIECQALEEPEYIQYSQEDKLESPKGAKKSKHKDKDKHEKKQKPFYHLDHWAKGILGVVLGAGILILAVLNLTIPPLAMLSMLGGITLATLYLGKEIYIKGIQKLIHTQKLNMNILYTISTLTIVAVSIISFFVPGMPLILEAAPLILGLWHIGKEIEHSLKKKALSNLKMQDLSPKKIGWLNSEGIEKKCSVKKIIPNDVIIVHEGQVIPLDGECLESNKSLFTTRINGSPYPKTFNKGDLVLAGMRVPEGESMRIRVTQTFARSYLSRVDQHIKNASSEKAPIELFTDKILQLFIPGLLLIAGISGLVIGFLFTPALGITCIITVLVSACPCALAFITPGAVKIGMNKAAKQGIHFKNGKTLQAAAKVKKVVCDLNGTLTTGKPEVTECEIDEEKISKEKFYQWVTLLEEQSEHPVAKAIIHFFSKKMDPDLELPTLSEIDTSHHSGIKAVIDGKVLMIGNENYLDSQGIKLSRSERKSFKSSTSNIYAVLEGEMIGKIGLSDPLRPDAIQFINALKKQGKEVHICTGADEKTAIHYGKLLGIPRQNIYSSCVGTISQDGEKTKTSYINELKENGDKVAMIGDAANDAPAITASDCGIAIKSEIGDEITQQHAGAIVQNESLMSIVTAFEVATLTKSNIIQNLIISLTYNSIVTFIGAGVLIFFGITLNPILGIALMILETSIVILNTYRFSQQKIASDSAAPELNVTDEIEEDSSLHTHNPSDTSQANLNFNHLPNLFVKHEKDENLNFGEESSDEENSIDTNPNGESIIIEYRV